jgi:hypothetical protein
VEAFYAWYVPMALSGNPVPAWDLALKRKRRVFTSDLFLQLREDLETQSKAGGHIVRLDYDPFLNCHDCGERYVAERITTKGGSYWAEVHGVWSGKESATPDVMPELVPQDRGWLFVNFHYPNPSRPEFENLLSQLNYLRVLRRAGPSAEKFAPQNFEVLGITLGTSELTDLGRILGPGTSRETPDHEGLVTCYCSPGDDRTVLEFDSWVGTIVEFRFFQGSPQKVSQCAESRLVSKSLATRSGLKLGMGRSEVTTLLGAPTKTQEDHFIYESSYDRLATPEEVKQSNDAFAPLPALISVYEKIDLRFGSGKVVRVEVLRGNEIAE